MMFYDFAQILHDVLLQVICLLYKLTIHEAVMGGKGITGSTLSLRPYAPGLCE